MADYIGFLIVTFIVTIRKVMTDKIKVKSLFRAFPSLRSGRAFQPSLTLILPLRFVRTLRSAPELRASMP